MLIPLLPLPLSIHSFIHSFTLSLSLSLQLLWVTFPSFQVSPTQMRWIPICPSTLALHWRWLQGSCRCFLADRACSGALWMSRRSLHCRPYRPGSCTALPKQPEKWCSRCWLRRSQMSKSSATLQVYCIYLYILTRGVLTEIFASQKSNTETRCIQNFYVFILNRDNSH